ncbi:hypothetical protein BHM03_00029466 [Ensete ventricosum]|nr:hypothetical protein BHM03_00029466 [Ensete ventricosum]
MRSDGLPCEILCVGGSTKQERAGQKSGGHEAAKRYADVDQWKEVLYWWLGHDRCPALGAFSEAGPPAFGMNSEESSKSRLEELGRENTSETTVKMAPLSEIKAEFGGELGGEEPSGIDSPIGTGGADQIREERGSVSPGEAVVSSPGAVNVNVGGEFLAESPSNSSAAAEVVASKLAPSKGYGLKKWRRIRRDLNKDITGSADTAQILKRRLSLAEPSKAHEDNKHKSDCEDEAEGEGSVASLVSMNIGGTPCVVAPTTLDPELGLLVTATGFNIGIESESSDDHGSKSSTAASAPRLRHEMVGFGRDRSRARNVIGRVPGHILQQRGQRAKGVRTDVKKITENQVKIEMENSYSDLRSSNVAVFCTNNMASNGKQSEKSVNYSGEQSDDAQPSGEVISGFYKENGGVGDVLRDDFDSEYSGGENKSKSQPVLDLDPFLESIDSLQAIKEALENGRLFSSHFHVRITRSVQLLFLFAFVLMR